MRIEWAMAAMLTALAAPEVPRGLLAPGGSLPAPVSDSRVHQVSTARARPSPADGAVEGGVLKYEAGAFAEAINSLEAALKVDPHHPKGLYYLGNAYWRIEDYTKAGACFKRLVGVDPGGPFSDDARDWIKAQGSFDVLASRIAVQSATPRPGFDPKVPEFVSQDGFTRLVPPTGFTRVADELVKAGGQEMTKLRYQRDLGAGGKAILLIEAHHKVAALTEAQAKKGIPGLADIADRILSDLGIAEYDLVGARTIGNVQEQDVESTKDGRMGLIRAVYVGKTLLVTVLVAPKAAWALIAKPALAAVASVRYAEFVSSVVASPLPSASPSSTPAPVKTPGVPGTFLMPRPGDPTLPPGLYPAPWATSNP